MNPLDTALTLLAATSWRIGLLIVLCLALRRMLRGRLPAAAVFAVWLVLAFAMLVPVGIPARWSPFGLIPLPKVAESEVAAVPAVGVQGSEFRVAPLGAFTVPEVTSLTTGPAMVPVPTAQVQALSLMERLEEIPAARWATLVWLAGVAVLVLRRAAALMIFSRKLRRSLAPADERIASAVERCRELLGIRGEVLSGVTSLVETPALHGIFAPRLLMPVGMAERLSEAELELVVLHELGHVRRRDLLAQTLIHAATVLHWFNPLAWLAAHAARADCEHACDEFVLGRVEEGRREDYGAVLLKVVGLGAGPGRLPAVLGIFESKKQLQHRIHLIADYSSPHWIKSIAGVVLLTLVALVGLTRESEGQQAAATAAPAIAAGTEVTGRTFYQGQPGAMSSSVKVRITADGAVLWQGEGIALDELIVRLHKYAIDSTPASAGAGAVAPQGRIEVEADGAARFSQVFGYVANEVRKVNFQQVYLVAAVGPAAPVVIENPSVAPTVSENARGLVVIQVSVSGRVYWNQAVVAFESLAGRLQKGRGDGTITAVKIAGDRWATFQDAVRVIDLVRQAGINNFAVETRTTTSGEAGGVTAVPAVNSVPALGIKELSAAIAARLPELKALADQNDTAGAGALVDELLKQGVPGYSSYRAQNDGDLTIPIMILAQTYADAGQVENAGEVLLEAARASKAKDTILWSFAVSYFQNAGKQDRAIAVMQESVDKVPGNGDYVLRLANTYYNGGQVDEAISVIHAAIRKGATAKEPEMRLAEAYFLNSEKRYPEASVAVAQGLARPNLSADVTAKLQQLKDVADANSAGRGLPPRVNSLPQSQLPINAAPAFVQLTKDQAITDLKQAADKNPADGQFDLQLANTYFSLGRVDEAIASIQAAIRKDVPGKEPTMRLSEAYYLYAANRYTEASEAAAKGLALPNLASNVANQLKQIRDASDAALAKGKPLSAVDGGAPARVVVAVAAPVPANTSVSDASIDQEIARQEREDFGGDRAKFLAHIESLGLPREQYRLRIAEGLVARNVMAQVPGGTAQMGNATPVSVAINVSRDGSILLQGELVSMEELLVRLKKIATEAAPARPTVLVRADPATSAASVIRVIDALKESGLTNMSLATTAPQPAPADNGGRQVLDVKDVPPSYSAVNREFTDALGVTPMPGAAQWTPGPTFAAAAVRTVMVLGQVRKSGNIQIPTDRPVTVVDVIVLADGFTDLAKSNGVKVTRIMPDGTQKTWDNVDVGGMMAGRVDRKDALVIQPGDVVNVPMRIF